MMQVVSPSWKGTGKVPEDLLFSKALVQMSDFDHEEAPFHEKGSRENVRALSALFQPVADGIQQAKK